jgi:hypothetical protein
MNSLQSLSCHAKANKVVGYKYYKLDITAVVDITKDGYVQMSEFIFTNNSSDIVIQPTNVDVTNPDGSNPVNEIPSKLVDGTTTTNFLDFSFKTKKITTVIFNFQNRIIANGYRWVTGNDTVGRDPTSWILSGSNDNNIWVVLSTVSNYSPSTDRKTSTIIFSF